MNDPVEFLDLEDVVALAVMLFGQPAPVNDIGLLGSAVARPRTTLDGHDAYLDLWSKAAALLQSIVSNHALIDGNKRLGWLSCAVFLEMNGISITDADNDRVYALVMHVAGDHPSLDEITDALRGLVGTDPAEA